MELTEITHEITHTWPEDEIHSKTQMSRFRHLQTNMSA